MIQMSKQKSNLCRSGILILYAVLLLATVLFGIFKNYFPFEKNGYDTGRYELLIKGSTEKIGKSKTVKKTVRLPENISSGTVLFVYSNHQDVNIKVNGKTILAYDSTDQTGRWIIQKLDQSMSDQRVMITMKSSGKTGTTYMTPVYIGDKTSIIYQLIRVYGYTVLTAVLMMFIGLLMVVGTSLIRMDGRWEFICLGAYFLFAGLWLAIHSRLRQLYWAAGNDADIMMIVVMIIAIASFLSYFILGVRRFHQSDQIVLRIGTGGLLIGCLVDLWYRGIMKSTDSCIGVTWGDIVFVACGIYEFIRWNRKRCKKERYTIANNEEKTVFLEKMSHQIRTPVNSVLGMNTLIEEESRNPDVIEYANDIENAGNVLVSIIDDILDFSKINTGEIELQPVSYRMSSLLNDCYNMISIRATEKDLKFDVSVNKTMPDYLYGDMVRIRQIMMNLLTNAVKYTETGKVELNLDYELQDEDSILLKIEVRDTGIGIQADNLDKLFIPYQRVDQKKNRSIEGTGLGLSITRHLVELMKGEIQVDSVYGSGSVFSVVIPQRVMDKEVIGTFDSRLSSADSFSKQNLNWFTAEGAKILVVDDAAMNCKVMAGILKKTRMQIQTAGSGEECIKRLADDKYDIIFMDHLMPGIDGIQTLHAIKAQKRGLNYNTPVVMLTANALVGARQEYLEEGFSDYLSKPVNARKLLEVCLRFIPEWKIKPSQKPEENSQYTEKTEHIDKPAENSQYTEETKENEEIIEKEYAENHEEQPQSAMEELNQFLDTETGMEYCMEDEDLYLEIIQDYIDNSRKEELEKAYKESDYHSYCVSVHALKSTSKTIGAMKLSELAKELEDAASREDAAYIASHHDSLIAKYDELLGRLQDAVSMFGK